MALFTVFEATMEEVGVESARKQARWPRIISAYWKQALLGIFLIVFATILILSILITTANFNRMILRPHVTSHVIHLQDASR